MQEIKITSRNLKLTPTLKEQILKKINKHKKLLSKATLIEVELLSTSQGNPTNITYDIKISVKVPNSFLKVKESGKDILSVLDIADSTLFRLLEKYKETNSRKKHKTPITFETIGDIEETEEIYNYYEPLIKKKTYQDDRPKHPAEAIEQMELLNMEAYLFRSIDTQKYSMVYKMKNGKYGLIEPRSE